MSALHESGKIKFVGRFDDLEDELLSSTTTGYTGQGSPNRLDWFVCAFGAQEQACVSAGINQGGHARVGFENNLQLPDGEIASSTAELVSDLSVAILATDRPIASSEQARQILGIRSA